MKDMAVELQLKAHRSEQLLSVEKTKTNEKLDLRQKQKLYFCFL